MRYTEIDGKRKEIERCAQCPFLVVEYRRAKEPTCRYPYSEKFIDLRWIDYTKEVHSGCPLREVVE